MSNELTIENQFIERLVEEKTPVAVFLRNGIKLTGLLVAADDDCLYLKNVLLQLIYKHAVNTIQPSASSIS